MAKNSPGNFQCRPSFKKRSSSGENHCLDRACVNDKGSSFHWLHGTSVEASKPSDATHTAMCVISCGVVRWLFSSSPNRTQGNRFSFSFWRRKCICLVNQYLVLSLGSCNLGINTTASNLPWHSLIREVASPIHDASTLLLCIVGERTKSTYEYPSPTLPAGWRTTARHCKSHCCWKRMWRITF